MSELHPTDAELNALSGSTDSEQEVLYIPMGQSPYYTSFYKMLHRLLNVARRSGDLRVYKDGAMTFGVRAGRFLNSDTPVNFTGATAQALANNAVNYIYLTAAGVLTVNTSSFPTPSATPHLPLATIATGTASAGGVSGTYAEVDITDYRGRAIFQPAAGASAAIPEEITSFFAATDITGAEAETLSNNSNADSLHLHNIDNLTDGASYKKLSASNHGTLTSSGDADSLHSHAAKLNKALVSGHIFVGNGSGIAANVAMSGDATISNSGAVTIANDAITNAKIAANAAIARSKMETQQQFPFRIPMTSCRANKFNPLDTWDNQIDSTSFIIDNPGWQGEMGCGDVRLVSYEANSQLRTSYCFFEFIIPPEYVAGSTITLRIRVGTVGDGEYAETHNIKIQAFKVSDDGQMSAPIGNSGTVNFTYDFSNIDVTVNGSTLSPGDRLTACIRTRLQMTNDNFRRQCAIGSIIFYCDIRG